MSDAPMQAFTCAACGKRFLSAYTNEEADKEYEAKYGPNMGEEVSVVCTNCANEFDKWYEENVKRLSQ